MDWHEVGGEELFAQLPEAALVIDADGRIQAGNHAAAKLFELPEPFPTTTVETLLTEPERVRLQPLQWLRKWADRPDAPELDYVLLTGVTNSRKQLQLSVRVTRLANNQSGLFLVMLRDMGLWETRLRSERDAHRLATRLLALSADGLITTNDKFEIAHINLSAAQLFGFTSRELIGQPLSRLLPERFHAAHTKHMQRFAGESTPSRKMSERSEIVGLSRTGKEIPIEASITRIALRDSTVFCAQIRDLRARKKSQKVLKSA